MLSVVDELTEGRGSNFFLFVDKETLKASDPLKCGVDDGEGGEGEADSLIDFSVSFGGAVLNVHAISSFSAKNAFFTSLIRPPGNLRTLTI